MSSSPTSKGLHPRYRLFIQDFLGHITELAGPWMLHSYFSVEKIRACVVCKRSDLERYVPLENIFSRLHSTQTNFAVITPYRPPPHICFRIDEVIESFVCDGSLLTYSLGKLGDEKITSAYEVLSLLSNAPPGRVRIDAWQVPNDLTATDTARFSAGNAAVDWIIPHSGELHFLEQSLHFTVLANTSKLRGNIRVGIDDPPSSDASNLLRRHGVTGFFASHPRMGPYPIRNELMKMSTSDFVCFQDSDDVPCHSRLSKLIAGFTDSKVGMVGSHEVRMDEIARQINAVRYPLDVTEALLRGALQAQLHGTAMVRRQLFFAAGGFSTTHRFAMDTQFLLRSAFYFHARNVDTFAYIRRVWKGSLTQHKDTGMQSLERKRVSRNWRMEFRSIREGTAKLESTSLAVRNGMPQDYQMIAVN